MSVNTFRTHTRHIFTKLDVNDPPGRRTPRRRPRPALARARSRLDESPTRSHHHGDVRSPRPVPSVLTSPDTRPAPGTRSHAMTVTTTGLTKAAGVAAAVAGRHLHRRPDQPPAASTPSLTDTTQWVVRELAKTVMAALALAGHHRHVPAPGTAEPASSGWSATSSSPPATWSCSPPRSSPRPSCRR